MKQILPIAVAMLLFFIASSLCAQEEKAKPIDKSVLDMAWNMITKAESTLKRTKTWTCEFHKREFVKGKMMPKEVMFQKYRQNPRRVYQKWIGSEKKNQEVIWGPKWNDGKIRAHKGSFPDITVNLDPKGGLAMTGNRHPITEIGFGHTIGLIKKDFLLIKQNPGGKNKVKDLGPTTIHGRKSHCFEAEMDKGKNKKFYAYKALICTDLTTNLPNRIKIWDFEKGKVRLVEHYEYAKIKKNVPLTEKDFDPENEAYDF